MKKVFITGISGQDGSILARKFLSTDCYEVHGLVRRTSNENLDNLKDLDPKDFPELILHRGDILEASKLQQIIRSNKFDYIYHEADQDNVGYSFENPSSSINVTVQGTLNVLEALEPGSPTRVFIPCSSTMFGPCTEAQTLDTPFNPQSPYAVAKAAVFNLCRIYRKQRKLKLHVGIMYNHDSEYRNGDYLLHRICKAIVTNQKLNLGFPDEKVWIGCAYRFMSDVVQMVENFQFEEFLIGASNSITVRDLVDAAYTVIRKEFNHSLPEQRVINYWDLPPREGISSVLYPAPSIVTQVSYTNYFTLCYKLLKKYGAKL